MKEALIFIGLITAVFSVFPFSQEIEKKLVTFIMRNKSSDLQQELHALQAASNFSIDEPLTMPEYTPMRGRTLLDIALNQYPVSVAILRILMNFGADINQRVILRQNRITPLTLYLHHPTPLAEVLQLLVNNADAYSLNEVYDGYTPLIFAILRSRENLVIRSILPSLIARIKFLQDQGAVIDINRVIRHTKEQKHENENKETITTTITAEINALKLACSTKGNGELIGLLLDVGADPRILFDTITKKETEDGTQRVNHRRLSCLHIAIEVGDIDAFTVLFEYFIKHKMDLYFNHAATITLLQSAVVHMNLPILEMLLPHMDPNILPTGSRTLLNEIFSNLYKKNPERAKKIIAILLPRINLNRLGADRIPALFSAYLNNMPEEIIHLLLHHGANINQLNSEGFNLVQMLVLDNERDTLERVLHDFGPHINLNEYIQRVGSFDGQTLLMMAISNNNIEMVKYLLEQGADYNKPDEQNLETPLMMAIRKGHLEIADLLLNQSHINVNALNSHNQNVLFYILNFAEDTALKLADQLLRAGIDPTIVDSSGNNVISTLITMYLPTHQELPLKLITFLLLQSVPPYTAQGYTLLARELLQYLSNKFDPDVLYLLKLLLIFGYSLALPDQEALANALSDDPLIRAAALGNREAVKNALETEHDEHIILEAFAMALGQGHVEVVQLLQEMFPDIHISSVIPHSVIRPVDDNASPLTFLGILKNLLKTNPQKFKKMAEYFATLIAKRKLLFIYQRGAHRLLGKTRVAELPDNVRDQIFQNQLEQEYPKWFADLVDSIYHQNREIYLAELNIVSPPSPPPTAQQQDNKKHIIGRKRPAEEQPTVDVDENYVRQKLIELQAQVRQAKRGKIKADSHEILDLIKLALTFKNGEALTDHIVTGLTELIDKLNTSEPGICQEIDQLIITINTMLQMYHRGGPYERYILTIRRELQAVRCLARQDDIQQPGPALPRPSSR